MCSPAKCVQLSYLIRVKNLKDVFRSLHPNSTVFRTSAAPSRLDRFYLPSDQLVKVGQVEHVALLSDHCGVVMELKIKDITTCYINREGRKTYWKLNNANLKDDEFLSNFSDLWCWLKSLKPSYSDIADWWDIVAKPSIKDFCLLFSNRRSNRRKDTKKFWFAYLKTALHARHWRKWLELKIKLTLSC